ncbi:MAG: hypothetical protein GY750_06715 [Lentisphaerae bacterium]|nr:hypothetical protein [Lentisphaerota bacterium]MCP4101101.1 hypothetical protein [Lentisphaerota bacterium]
MKEIAKLNSSVHEVAASLYVIFKQNSKYLDKHVRFQDDTLFFNSGFPKIINNSSDRIQKRKAATYNIHLFFKKQFPPQYSSLYNKFKTLIPAYIKGRDLKFLCARFTDYYKPLIKTFKYQYEHVLNQMYMDYLRYDVIVLGSRHGPKDNRAHSFLRDFLKFIHKEKSIKISKRHTIFYEHEISMYSHYKRRRKLSDYSPESEYEFKYHSGYENPNVLNDNVYAIPCELLDYEKTSWFKNHRVKMMFYDDNLTGPRITKPEKIWIYDEKYKDKKFNKDLERVKEMYRLKEFPKPDEKCIDGSQLSYEIRLKANCLIARRICNDICKTKKSFIPIGVSHIEHKKESNGNMIPTLQHFLHKYLDKYGKKVFILKFIEKDMPSFDRVRDKYVDATISWPAWIS